VEMQVRGRRAHCSAGTRVAGRCCRDRRCCCRHPVQQLQVEHISRAQSQGRSLMPLGIKVAVPRMTFPVARAGDGQGGVQFAVVAAQLGRLRQQGAGYWSCALAGDGVVHASCVGLRHQRKSKKGTDGQSHAATPDTWPQTGARVRECRDYKLKDLRTTFHWAAVRRTPSLRDDALSGRRADCGQHRIGQGVVHQRVLAEVVTVADECAVQVIGIVPEISLGNVSGEGIRI
jgi:hypothetical protein